MLKKWEVKKSEGFINNKILFSRRNGRDYRFRPQGRIHYVFFVFKNIELKKKFSLKNPPIHETHVTSVLKNCPHTEDSTHHTIWNSPHFLRLVKVMVSM